MMRTNAFGALLVVLGLAACGEKEAGPSAPSTPPAPVRRLFLTNLEGLDAFVVGDDGRLTSQSRLTPTRGISSSMIAADGKHLYLSNQGGLEGYRIDPTTGAISALPGSPFAADRSGLVADPRGRFVWVRGAGAGTIATYRIDAATGALSRVGGPFAVQSGLLWVEPQGRFAFTSRLQDLWVYRIDDAGAWTPTARAPYTIPREAPNTYRFAFGRNTPFVYTASQDDGRTSSKLVTYRLDPATGDLTVEGIVPTPGDRTPSSIVVNEAGTFLYVAMRNTNSNNTQPPALYAYRIDGATGALTDTANVSVPARMNVFSSDLGLSSDGKFLFMSLEPTPFVLPLGAADLAVFRVDGASMTAVGSAYTVGSDPHTFHSFVTQP
jgi:DNA-binding beta-propeller fold protein YncE